jgi:hypothetical protein
MGKQARARRERQQQRDSFKFDVSKFLEMYKMTAPAIIYKHFTASCCLNATRIFIDVADAYGITAQPAEVGVRIYNKKFWDHINMCSEAPDGAEVQRWLDDGAYMIEVDITRTKLGPNEWAGHLVAMVGHTMVDSSARQFSRPLVGINAPDVLMADTNPAFREGRSMFLEMLGGAVADYKLLDRAPTYEGKLGFRQHAGNLDAARLIILAIDGRLPKAWKARSLPKSL